MSHARDPPLVIDAARDEWVSAHAGGSGSLSWIRPGEFDAARKHVVTALLHHSSIVVPAPFGTPSEELVDAWRSGLRALESNARKHMKESGHGEGCSKACRLAVIQSRFLLRVRPSTSREEVVASGSWPIPPRRN